MTKQQTLEALYEARETYSTKWKQACKEFKKNFGSIDVTQPKTPEEAEAERNKAALFSKVNGFTKCIQQVKRL